MKEKDFYRKERKTIEVRNYKGKETRIGQEVDCPAPEGLNCLDEDPVLREHLWSTRRVIEF